MEHTNKIPIELLAPARDLTVGKAAIDCGADAVYIGADRFGARQAAANTPQDIHELSEYAHQYGAKVWVALNTILNDNELQQAEHLAWEVYHAGADGLIIQDMGLLEGHLPPLRLHASTQCNNTTLAKIQWLEQIGFQRVVLARELGINEITEIHNNTHIELEAFVHGALCVSYSGECYLSEALQGRSANRGECAQLCRMPYDLLDKQHNCIAQQKYLLSLHDMDRSEYLLELLRAGVTSLKIEGRLKGEDYVRNVVSYYRKALDNIFQTPGSPYTQAAKGVVNTGFLPDLNKTFRRGQVDYFLHGRTSQLANWNTPKSTGEYIGKVIRQTPDYIEIDSSCNLHNGDGITFSDKGFNVNKAVGNRIYPNKMPLLKQGTPLYRNFDKQFLDNMLQARTSRRIPVPILFKQIDGGYLLQIGNHRQAFRYIAEPADKPEQALANIRQQLQKLGNTVYQPEQIQIQVSFVPFIPTSLLNQWRRCTLASTPEEPTEPSPSCNPPTPVIHHPALPADMPRDYRLNVLNSKARAFYAKCGADNVESAYEASHSDKAALMRCKYCILFEMGQCRKNNTATLRNEPAYLRTQNGRLLHLHFDCNRCEMRIEPPQSPK